MTVEGFHIGLQDVDFEGHNAKKVALTIPPGFMDQLYEKWQKFKSGTSEEYLLIERNYFDDHADMDWVKYVAMEYSRLHGNKSGRTLFCTPVPLESRMPSSA